MMKLAGLAALAAVTLPMTAFAQEAAAPAQQAKPITRAEIDERLNKDYADLDADKDGKVGAAEIKARLIKGAEADLAVIKKARDEGFAKFDTNKDGNISRAEFDAQAPLPTIKDPDAKPFLDRFDANKDGSISQEEFRAPTLANFTRADGNKDGTLSVAEQKAATPARKAPAVKQTPVISR